MLTRIDESSAYHWEWDPRVILNTSSLPSDDEIDAAYKTLLNSFAQDTAPGPLPEWRTQWPPDQRDRMLTVVQDAYEHLRYLVRVQAGMPPIPHRFGFKSASEEHAKRLFKDLSLRGKSTARLHGESTERVVVPAVVKPEHVLENTFIRRRSSVRNLSRITSPPTTPTRRQSQQRLRRKPSRASSAASSLNESQPKVVTRKPSRTSLLSLASVGSQVSNSSEAGVDESLEAMLELVTKGRTTVAGLRKRRWLRGSVDDGAAAMAGIVQHLDALSAKIVQFQGLRKTSVAPAEYSFDEHMALVRLFDDVRMTLRRLQTQTDSNGVDAGKGILEELRRENYVDRLNGILGS
ncbi:hypothetical protein NKR23_g6495 [Pleurostoma richardsiae]|uniref:Uncharacterized protein n=1 Tax=Pleurostoma richardsiae TaxID=41990 RepID=A0AA38RAF7_9PEZI|nr:hypothetical protein NKR23_g6495 [Pleurostoma richardsiae]